MGLSSQAEEDAITGFYRVLDIDGSVLSADGTLLTPGDAGYAAAALREGCVQQVAAVIAPKLLGGTPARTPLGDLGFTDLDQLPLWEPSAPQRLGTDLLWTLNGPT